MDLASRTPILLAAGQSTWDTVVEFGTLLAGIGTVLALFVLVWQTTQMRRSVAQTSDGLDLTRQGLEQTRVGLELTRAGLKQSEEALEDLREAALGAHFDATSQRILDLDLLFIENPRLRTHIYRGPDDEPAPLPEDPAQLLEALAIAEYVIDTLDTEILRNSRFPRVEAGLPGFEPWIRDAIMDSQPVCFFLTDSWEWYSKDLLARYADLAKRGMAAWTPAGEAWKFWTDASILPDDWVTAVDRKT